MDKKTIKEYRAWKAMKARCNAPSVRKGVYLTIEVCDRWKKSYKNFLTDMGAAPSDKHSLDRIDNSKGYSPENCRWASQIVQASNRGSFNKVFTHEGQSFVLKEWSRILGIKYTTLYLRIYRNGLSFEEAIVFDSLYEYNGVKTTLKAIVEQFGVVRYMTVVDRMHRGWELEKALKTPLRSKSIMI